MGCTPSSHASSEPSSSNYLGNESGTTGNQAGDGIPGQFRTTSGSLQEESVKKPPTSLITQANLPRSESNSVHPSSDLSTTWNVTLDNKENQFLKFGPMCLNPPKVTALLVFAKEDAQTGCLKLAAEKLRFQCWVVNSAQKALETYQETKATLVIIDTRQSDRLDPLQVCKSIRAVKGSQYTCIVAVVKKGLAEKEEASVLPLIKSGFNRWFLESCNFGFCLNELIQLEHNEISNMYKLRAAQALFSALDCCREGVLVTSPKHDIQFINQASERLLGHPASEILGKNAQELQRSDSQKREQQNQIETVNRQYRKSKEWEASMLNRKKSGEYLHFWNKMATIESHKGCVDHLVYVKDVPHFLEKSFSTDPDMLSYSALKAMRKTSCDVRSLCSENNTTNATNRRQSFAKFHALTIEAPITKVINLLVNIQDNCQLPIAQQLDKVLDILRSTELYSPQFPGLNQNHINDQVTSDLVSGLMSGHKSALRKMSHEVTGKGPTLPPTPTASLPSLATAPLHIKLLLETEMEWGFDIFELEKITTKRPLIWLGMAIFSRFDVCTSLNCDEATLQNWFSLIEANYHDNPYHNSTHAADVMQATAYFLQKLRLKNIFDSIDEAICLVAAVVHDIDHPGKNSAFLCNSGNELAVLYNDLSVLESHHAAKAFQLTMGNEKANILKNLDRETYRDVRQSIIDMVLATEMTKHFEHISKFVNSFEKTTPMENEVAECDSDIQLLDEGITSEVTVTREIVVLVKRMLIKCADVSNPARPIQLCAEWASRIAEEYCNQTDEERKLGLTVVMPAFDRKTCNIPKSQIGFMEFFVNDMFDAWDAFGNFPELLEELKSNYLYWREKEQKDKEKSNHLEQVAQDALDSS